MHNPLKERVIRVFLSVLDSMESLAEESLEVEDVRPQIQHLFKSWPDSPVGSEEKLTQAALVYWIDDLLIHENWPGASKWRGYSLEHALLGTGNGAWQFFEAAETARHLGYTDALEVFAACTRLGFQGVYRKRRHLRQPQRHVATSARSGSSLASNTARISGSVSQTANSTRLQATAEVATATAEPAYSSVNSSALEWPPRRTRDEVLSGLPATIDQWKRSTFGELGNDGDLAEISSLAGRSKIPTVPRLLVTATAMIALVVSLCCLVWPH